MKIHNLGNDYAHQQKLKKETGSHKSSQSIVEPHSEPTDYVEHQIQAGGQAEMATVNNEVGPETKVISQESKKNTRKKKKERADI